MKLHFARPQPIDTLQGLGLLSLAIALFLGALAIPGYAPWEVVSIFTSLSALCLCICIALDATGS